LLEATPCLLFLTPLAGAQTPQPTLRGFTPASSAKERADEKVFMSVPDSAHARAALQTLTAEPHMAGSQGDHRTVAYVLRQFQSFGLDAGVEDFQATLSEPGDVRFELLEPVKFSGPTPEFVAEDPASKDPRTSPNFIAFSGSSDVTSEVVYVNYGMVNDYDVLRSQGISVEGKIVIARYGKCYRGAKAMAAELNKGAGLMIYSDPEDDGYHAGDIYPKGPWRPESGAQRGSVLYDFIYPGVLPDGSTVPRFRSFQFLTERQNEYWRICLVLQHRANGKEACLLLTT
jgi:N-acetylated-alpha-linked acidic dipeptidase